MNATESSAGPGALDAGAFQSGWRPKTVTRARDRISESVRARKNMKRKAHELKF
jgi:hypothetical protein